MEEPRKGFPYWKEKASFQINELYGIIDLSDMIRRFNADCICQTIIHDKNSADYADGLFRYNLVDEMVLYTLPISYGKGFSLMDSIGNIIGNSALSNCTPMAFPVWCTKKRRM